MLRRDVMMQTVIGPRGSNSMAGGFVMGVTSGLRRTRAERGEKSAMIWWPGFEPGEDDYIHVHYAQGRVLR